MSRPIVEEDFFDHHVKRIFRKLKETWKEEESKMPFADWLASSSSDHEITTAFIDDVENWMGLDEAIALAEGRETP